MSIPHINSTLRKSLVWDGRAQALFAVTSRDDTSRHATRHDMTRHDIPRAQTSTAPNLVSVKHSRQAWNTQTPSQMLPIALVAMTSCRNWIIWLAGYGARTSANKMVINVNRIYSQLEIAGLNTHCYDTLQSSKKFSSNNIIQSAAHKLQNPMISTFVLIFFDRCSIYTWMF